MKKFSILVVMLLVTFFNYKIVVSYAQEVPSEPVDLCMNIEGVQDVVPDGMVQQGINCGEDNGSGQDTVDVCSNIKGVQPEVPGGNVLMSDGSCTEEGYEADLCTNFVDVQLVVPQGYISKDKVCKPLENICTNGYDFDLLRSEGYVYNQDQCAYNGKLELPGDKTSAEPVVDVCPNIRWVQLSVPEGKQLEGDNCVDVPVTPTATTTTETVVNPPSGGGVVIIPAAYTSPAVVSSASGVSIGLASTQLQSSSASQGQVLGAETSCGIYLDFKNEAYGYGHVRYGGQVKLIQEFLNKYENESLPTTGYFGNMTLNAVKRFQVKHAAFILSPWNLTEATGVVYRSTINHINNIACPGILPVLKQGQLVN